MASIINASTSSGVVTTADTSGILQFQTNGTATATIDTSGNVGIGTASPAAKLDVVRSNNGVAFRAYNSGNSIGCDINVGTGNVYFEDNTGNNFYALNPSNNYLWFGSNGAERMRIDSSGNVLVGTTAQLLTEKMAVKSTATYVATFQNATNTSGYGSIYSSIGSAGNNTSTFHFQGNTNAVGNWYLYGNGTTSYSSDQRLKKNIQTTRDGYIDDLCKLRVVKYNWKNDAEGTPLELGLIAQEVEQVFPNLVQDDIGKISPEDDTIYKQLKASVLPFMLLKAIQEQQTIINDLKARIETLEGAK